MVQCYFTYCTFVDGFNKGVRPSIYDAHAQGRKKVLLGTVPKNLFVDRAATYVSDCLGVPTVIVRRDVAAV